MKKVCSEAMNNSKRANPKDFLHKMILTKVVSAAVQFNIGLEVLEWKPAMSKKTVTPLRWPLLCLSRRFFSEYSKHSEREIVSTETAS